MGDDEAYACRAQKDQEKGEAAFSERDLEYPWTNGLEMAGIKDTADREKDHAQADVCDGFERAGSLGKFDLGQASRRDLQKPVQEQLEHDSGQKIANNTGNSQEVGGVAASDRGDEHEAKKQRSARDNSEILIMLGEEQARP